MGLAEDASSTSYIRNKPVDLPLDMSFMNLSAVEDLLTISEPRPVGSKSKTPPKNEEEKFLTRIVRFNNNFFSDLTKFRGIMDSLIVDPLLLSWLDLSFNSLTKVDDRIQCPIPLRVTSTDLRPSRISVQRL
ncbi:hypothetical protein LSAT2_026613 [Lamellibrachia satsuma]|nr:hypothetical protein LSAT2_026613 [Lamellibrachia satsuma]